MTSVDVSTPSLSKKCGVKNLIAYFLFSRIESFKNFAKSSITSKRKMRWVIKVKRKLSAVSKLKVRTFIDS